MRQLFSLSGFAACFTALALVACDAATPGAAADAGSGGDDLGAIGDAASDTATPDTTGADTPLQDIWAADQSDGFDPGTCPAEPQIGKGGCTKPNLICNYGQECCCGTCHPSTVCTCGSDGGWSCYATDACMLPPDACGDASQTDTSGASCTTDATCGAGHFCEFTKFACGGTGTCAVMNQICPAIYAPVCGCDGKTYGSECEAASVGKSVAKNGECPAACSANADCKGGQFCSKAAGGCGGNGTCSQFPDACDAIYAPVCGCDGKTYSSACIAAEAGINVATQGACATP